MARRTVLALAALLALTAAACGSSASGPASSLPVAPRSVPASDRSHVVVIVMENKERGDVLGTGEAPYLDRLARRYAQLTRSYGVTHPSLPNYLALTSGSTHGITSDCTDCHVRAANIVDRLERAHVSWKGYMQGLPHACSAVAGAGDYRKKHDPFMYYDDVAGDPRRCRKVVPFAELAGDLRAGRLPTFAFITPDMCQDTHDCSVATGDRFLANLVPLLLRQIGPRGYVVVTYDEGSSDAGCCGGSAGGRIATVVAGPRVRRGARLATPIDHYGVLATISRSLRVAPLGAARDPRHGSFAPVLAGSSRVR